MKRKALGRGLKSLIPQAPARKPGESPKPATEPAPQEPQSRRGLQQLDLDRIRPNRDQPRREFDQSSLEELAASIKAEGIIQPVIVRPVKNSDEADWELIAGERRWRASQIAGLLKVPALIRHADDTEVLELALIENIQREDLNPIEAATAFRTLIDDLGLTQADVAERVGKQRSTVANMLRLLDLPKQVKVRLREGSVSTGHAKLLASLSSPELQVKLAERVAREGLSVRETERLVKRVNEAPALSKERKQAERDPNIVSAEERLQTALGTKVAIHQGPKGGRIEMHFGSGEELARMYDILMSAARISQ